MKAISLQYALPAARDSTEIPAHARISVMFDNGQSIRMWIDNDGRLSISGGELIVIRPAGANLIRVEPA